VPTVIIERDHIESIDEDMDSATIDSELNSISERHTVVRMSSIDLFTQSSVDTTLAAEYAADVFSDDTFDVVSYYPNYFYPPPGTIDGTNDNYSYWYKHEDRFNSSYLNKSSLMDNTLGPLFKAGAGNYQGFYIGFEDGLFRHFPYNNVSVRFSGLSYTCQIDQTPVVGYDPRCRGWYVQAKTQPNEVILTNPYVDASTGVVVVTLAMSVSVNNKVIAVVGTDFEMQPLADSISSATFGDAGYTYVVHANGNIVLHPDVNTADGVVYTIQEFEFADSSAEEWAAFESILVNNVFPGQQGQKEFLKEGETWYVTYGPIISEAGLVESRGGSGSEGTITLLIVYIVASVVVLVVGVYLSQRIADLISRPVALLNRILVDMAENKTLAKKDPSTDRTTFRRGSTDLSSQNFMFLSVKFSTRAYYRQDYESALEYLVEAEKVFAEMNQQHALGIVYNNRGNILRRKHAPFKEFTSSIRQLQKAVDIARTMYDDSHKDYCKKAGGNFDAMKANAHARLLASRLLNLGDCLRESSETTKALGIIRESYGLFSRIQHTHGRLASLGNMGLIYQEMQRYEDAKEVFEEAIDLARGQYEENVYDEQNILALQHASMNMGAFHLFVIEKNGAVPKELPTHVELSLHHFYSTLTECAKMKKIVQTTCVAALQHIFTKYYEGDDGEEALEHLKDLYPQSFATSQKVGALNAISLGQIEMESL